ncbi:transcriptional regulator [Thermotoga neapolitana DSM 4359]|uniref:Transcriptional regulator n=1 Tax=Thermotoga neapolitana (strain ATCC 49049 / DSM 4359 / NBRC 107923 / NS-E) TaxID=309803 RepID=B9KB58_THENN|nr:transcriptional regulator [Thermotoga neapolitana DSM 4359]
MTVSIHRVRIWQVHERMGLFFFEPPGEDPVDRKPSNDDGSFFSKDGECFLEISREHVTCCFYQTRFSSFELHNGKPGVFSLYVRVVRVRYVAVYLLDLSTEKPLKEVYGVGGLVHQHSSIHLPGTPPFCLPVVRFVSVPPHRHGRIEHPSESPRIQLFSDLLHRRIEPVLKEHTEFQVLSLRKFHHLVHVPCRECHGFFHKNVLSALQCLHRHLIVLSALCCDGYNIYVVSSENFPVILHSLRSFKTRFLKLIGGHVHPLFHQIAYGHRIEKIPRFNQSRNVLFLADPSASYQCYSQFHVLPPFRRWKVPEQRAQLLRSKEQTETSSSQCVQPRPLQLVCSISCSLFSCFQVSRSPCSRESMQGQNTKSQDRSETRLQRHSCPAPDGTFQQKREEKEPFPRT